MRLVLRKCNKDGYSRNNFYYGNIGDRVICPDWDPKPKCGNGLHGLLKGKGDWGLLEGEDWLLIDADDQLVEIDNKKCKFNTGIIVYRGDKTGLIKYIDNLDIQNKEAYLWAKYIGNQEEMKQKITDSEHAYNWARNIGNQDEMKQKITESEYAFEWALDIGNQDEMKQKITDSKDAYYWAYNIGNQDEMINKITNSYYAYLWALTIGNQEEMKDRITDSQYAYLWIKNINPKDKECFINKLPELTSLL